MLRSQTLHESVAGSTAGALPRFSARSLAPRCAAAEQAAPHGSSSSGGGGLQQRQGGSSGTHRSGGSPEVAAGGASGAQRPRPPGAAAAAAAAAGQHPFRGSYSRGQAAAPASQPTVVPLTALHEGDPPSWPLEAPRRTLFSTVPVERVEGMHLRVQGQLPRWLYGSLYRNGPGRFEGAHAVFDGVAMIVRFRLDGATNEVVVSHRFLDTTYSQAVKHSGEIKWKLSHNPGTSTARGLAYAGSVVLGTLKWGMGLGDNALISIFPQGKELIAHTETSSGTYKVHPDTLETLGRVVYRDSVHGMVKTAHPHSLPNGDTIGMAADFHPTLDGRGVMQLPEITLYRQARDQVDVRQKIAAVPYLRPTSPTWIHQVAVSEHYAVVVQNPVFYNVRAMLLAQSTDFMVFDWRPEEGSLIHVVPLDGGKVRAYRAPAFLATHWVNAFEAEGGRLLHLDAAVTDTPALMSHFSLENMRAGPVGGKQIECSYLRRLTLDLSLPVGSFLDANPLLQPLVPDEAHGLAFDLPGINPNYISKPYRYAYGACAVRPSNCWNAIAKMDLQTGEVKVWHEAGGAAWEPVFVPMPGSNEEDEGVVLSTIAQRDGTTALLVLDARSWKEVARAPLPYGLPNGFHGCWVPSSRDEKGGGSSSRRRPGSA